MSQIRFQCYVCNQELQVAGDKAGRKAKCIQCGTVLTIPIAPDSIVAPAAGPGPAPLVPEAPPPRPDEPLPRGRDEAVRDRGRPDDYDRPRRGGDDRGRDERGYDERRPARDDYDDRGRRPRDDFDDRDRRPREEFDDRDRRRRDDYDDRDRPRDDFDERDRRRDYDDRERRRDDFDDYDDRGGKPKKWKTKWDKIRLGLLLAFIGGCVLGGGFVIEQIGAFIMTIMTLAQSGALGAPRYLGLIGNIFILLGWGCLLAGNVFWIFITNKNSGLVWAIVCISVGGVAFIFYMIFRGIPILSGGMIPYGPAIYIRGGFGFGFDLGLGIGILVSFALIFLATWFLMMGFYFRALALSQRDRNVGSRGMQLIITGAIAAGYQLLWPFLGWAFVHNRDAGMGALIAVWIFYWGGIAALIIVLLGAVRTFNMAR